MSKTGRVSLHNELLILRYPGPPQREERLALVRSGTEPGAMTWQNP